jgi:hypothetical protein
MGAIPLRLWDLPDISRRLSRAIFDVAVSNDCVRCDQNGHVVVMDNLVRTPKREYDAEEVFARS